MKEKSLGIESVINICNWDKKSTWAELAEKINHIKSWYEIVTKDSK